MTASTLPHFLARRRLPLGLRSITGRLRARLGGNSSGAEAWRPDAAPETVQVASFDVFDTLITRCWWQPTDLFLAVGEDLAKWGLLRDETPEAWAARRIRAEAMLRDQPGVEEVTLWQIHERLALEAGWSPELAEAAFGAELNHELAAIRPIACAIRELERQRERGADVALVSDTYFDHAFLQRLLRRAGIDVEDNRLFVSCERGATKRTGRLFPEVAAALGVRMSAIRHLGDHPQSDVANARAAGARALLFAEGAPTRYETCLHDAGAAYPAAMRSALAGSARVARLAEDAPNAHLRELRKIGSGVAGPLLAGFVLWVLEQARQRGIRRIHFVARDGQILQRIADRLCQRLGWDIECHYLYGSRQAWHLPSLQRVDDAALGWLLPHDTEASLRGALRRADLSPEAIADALERRGFASADWDAPVGADRMPALRAVLRQPDVERLILERAAERRRDALGYLGQEGLLGDGPVAIVDIGWHGRLQRSLRHLLAAGRDGTPAALTGFYLGLISLPPDVPADTLVSYLDTGTESPTSAWYFNQVLLEIFCAADHGTVRGYTQRPEDGSFAPVLAEHRDERVLGWGLRALQDAIAAFADEIGLAIVASGRPVEHWIALLHDAGCAAFSAFQREPSPTEAEAFGRFLHADGQMHDGFAPCAPKVGLIRRVRLGLGLRDPGYPGYWPEGSVQRGAASLGSALIVARRLRRRAKEALQGLGGHRAAAPAQSRFLLTELVGTTPEGSNRSSLPS